MSNGLCFDAYHIEAVLNKPCSERVRLPVNEDLEMTFVEEGSYKPTFTPYLCDSDEEQESSADKTLLQETGTAWLAWPMHLVPKWLCSMYNAMTTHSVEHATQLMRVECV